MTVCSAPAAAPPVAGRVAPATDACHHASRIWQNDAAEQLGGWCRRGLPGSRLIDLTMISAVIFFRFFPELDYVSRFKEDVL